jgi:type IV pilus assembly protein PilM
MAKRVTTLYIGDTDINLLSMKGMQVEKWASTPLAPGLVSQGLIADEAAVAEKVRDLFKEAGLSLKKVITALSGHDSLYRIITLPDVPEAVLPEAVRREARRAIPTPLDEVYYSYQSIPSMPGERRVFLVTFPRNSVDALVRTLRQAGVPPHVMDLAPLAIGRIPDVPRAIIVNSRLDHLEVMIIADRLPEVIRRLSLPGEAESLEETLPLIAEELNRTIMFYNSSHIDRPLDSTVPVFVSGDLAEVPETWQALVGDSGYSVSPLPSPVETPEGFNPNQFMINMGLALKEIRSDKGDAHFSLVDFNALPEAYIPPSFSILRVLIPVGLVVGAGLVVLAVLMTTNARAGVQDLQSQVTTSEARVRQLQTEVNTLRSDISSAEARRDTLSNRISALQLARAEMHEDLREIYRLAGGTITLATVNHTGGSVTVRGSGQNLDAAYRYARVLRESGRFSAVWISPICDAGSFTIVLTK